MKRNRPTITLTKKVGRNVRTKLNESAGKKYVTDQLRNKFNSLRARHKEFMADQLRGPHKTR